MRVFIAGLMQGSRQDELIGPQDYRLLITEALHKHIPDVEIVDPWAMHPNSVHYQMDEIRSTFVTMVNEAAKSDLILAYLPQASMGTALEMWAAHEAGRHIVAITPLIHNWVVRLTANEILPDLESLLIAIESGRFSNL